MKQNMKLKTLAGIVALSALAGCERQPQTDFKIAYLEPKLAAEAQKGELEAEIEITDVLVGMVPYMEGAGNGSTAAEHQFVWVMGSAAGKHVTLIYPYTAGIAPGHAHVKYRTLNGGISSSQFLREYNLYDVVGPDVFLQADGIIFKDGITRGE